MRMTEFTDYEIIVNPVVETNTGNTHLPRDLAIARAAAILKDHLPDADIWRVNTYDADDTAEEAKTGEKPVEAVGFNVETETEIAHDATLEIDAFESVEELGTAPIEN